MIATVNKIYDLEERTARFAESIIDICKSTAPSYLNSPIINQLIRSGTSVGANYCEANGASSKNDFRNKIHICKKEVQETKHWLRMLVKCNSETTVQARLIWREAQELTLIFGKITSSLKIKN